MKLFRKIKHGFTLVELVVVIAVIAILSGVGVGTYIAVTNNAKQSVANQEATQLVTAIRVQSVSTWHRDAATDDPAGLSVSVDWNSLDKCVEIKGVTSKEDALKALDDLVATSEGKEAYTWATNDSSKFEFLATSSEAKFLVTIPSNDDVVIDETTKVAKVKKLTLKHTNGFTATVLDSSSF